MEAAVHARFLDFEGADPARRDEGTEMIRTRALPNIQAQDGYVGYIGAFNDETRSMRAVVLWESREAAEAAEEKLAPMRDKLTGEFGIRVTSNEVYEAPIVDFAGAATPA
jgi:hypothetical protein